MSCALQGISEPTDRDVNYRGDRASVQWANSQAEDHNEWCYASLDDVRANMTSTEYPSDSIEYMKGKVQDTIPGVLPSPIALLRLDTDWYESTRHELEHLYPQLVPGGVLIIDDYGHWEGCREATDEYLARLKVVPLLHRIDRLGVIGIKPAG
jgi:hypothetical protein